jgi:hypothetical protein
MGMPFLLETNTSLSQYTWDENVQDYHDADTSTPKGIRTQVLAVVVYESYHIKILSHLLLLEYHSSR